MSEFDENCFGPVLNQFSFTKTITDKLIFYCSERIILIKHDINPVLNGSFSKAC